MTKNNKKRYHFPKKRRHSPSTMKFLPGEQRRLEQDQADQRKMLARDKERGVPAGKLIRHNFATEATWRRIGAGGRRVARLRRHPHRVRVKR